MTVLAFDTHKAVKELRAAGAAESLAEAVVATVGAAMGENVATKADVAALQADVKTDVAGVRAELAELKADVAAVQADMKTDVADVRTELAELKADVAAVQADMKANLAALESRLYRHLWVMAASIVGLTVTLVTVLS